jgi:hypothetical protein
VAWVVTPLSGLVAAGWLKGAQGPRRNCVGPADWFAFRDFRSEAVRVERALDGERELHDGLTSGSGRSRSPFHVMLDGMLERNDWHREYVLCLPVMCAVLMHNMVLPGYASALTLTSS